MSMTTPNELLSYWFGDLDDDGHPTSDRSMWWKKNPVVDDELRERFGDDVTAALGGRRDDWAQTPRGRLALILLLDQLTRNIHRDTPGAFAGDKRALEHSLEALERGEDRQLPSIYRVFVYMPLEHSEDTRLQARCCALFAKLRDEVPQRLRDEYTNYVDYAERHRVIIDRFGRFPHRNAILGRQPTVEELAFLEQPGSRF
jgi:uncharacterized protein (DUF924 family)